jgi:hypothetical protein
MEGRAVEARPVFHLPDLPVVDSSYCFFFLRCLEAAMISVGCCFGTAGFITILLSFAFPLIVMFLLV